MDESAWNEWVATRPEIVQDLCRRFPPDRLYRLKSSGHLVTIHSYSEDGTMTVNVSREFNAVIMDRQVFGISSNDLTECDPPSPDAVTGTLLTEKEDVDEFIEARRREYQNETKT